MYIIGFFFLTSWFGFFFLELDRLHVFICAITFIVSCILAIIVAHILEKKELTKEEIVELEK